MIEDILRSVLGMPPGVNKINKDLVAIRDITRPLLEEVIPWEQERELELMSLMMNVSQKKMGLDKVITGTIQSIYFEPMVAVAFKDYVRNMRDALLYCRTINRELVYRIKKNTVEIYLNGQQVAVLDQSQTLYGLRSKKALGAIRPYSSDLLSIVVRGRDVGHLYNPLKAHSGAQRAFHLMAEMDEEEEGIFLALGLYELVTRRLSQKKK